MSVSQVRALKSWEVVATSCVWAERSAGTLLSLVAIKGRHQLTSGGIPNPCSRISRILGRRCDDAAAVRAEDRASHRSLEIGHRRELPAGEGIPHAQGPVMRSRHNGCGSWSKRSPEHSVRVAAQARHEFPGGAPPRTRATRSPEAVTTSEPS